MSRARVGVITDTHSGHLLGLTPPQYDVTHSDPSYLEIDRLRRVQWDFFRSRIEQLKPFDVLLVLADMIHGKDKKNGGNELIVPSNIQQTWMAVDIIKFVDAVENYMVFGTPYHAGSDDNFESDIARAVGASIECRDFVDINGVVFDIRHKVGNSQSPQGQYTSIVGENIWNIMRSERNIDPRARVTLRGHVHRYKYAGETDWLGMTLPALSGGTGYGDLNFSGIIDFGFVHFDVYGPERIEWKSHIMKNAQSRQPKIALKDRR